MTVRQFTQLITMLMFGVVVCAPSRAQNWSPHSKPFDLVWDMDNEDFNGLPLNPVWAWQLGGNNKLNSSQCDPAKNKGQLPQGCFNAVPDFATFCGDAFSGGNNLDINKLRQSCTSQTVTLDLSPDFHPCGAPGCFCSGLIDGHLTWGAATQTGLLTWGEWSGNWKVTDWNDGDYDLHFQNIWYDVWAPPPKPRPHCETACVATTEESSLGLEFNDAETLDKAGAPIWQEMVNFVENGNPPSIGSPLDQWLTDAVDHPALWGVVVGVIGIDGVHNGGFAESHPVFALALRTDWRETENSLQEDWVFFLTNRGSGGGCSSAEYHWEEPQDTYTIQLPGFPEASDMQGSGLGIGGVWAWGWGGWNPTGAAGISRSADKKWTLIKAKNSSYPFGIDGEFTLTYSGFKGGVLPYPKSAEGHKPPPSSRPVPPREGKRREDSLNLTEVAARIADPKLRSKFMADVLAVKLPANPPVSAAQRVPLKLPPIGVEPRKPGAASRGELTKPVAHPDAVKQKRDEALKKVMEPYRSQIMSGPAKK